MSTPCITCKGRNDGIGAQACGIISVMVVAAAFNLRFVYTPIRYVAHYPSPSPSQTEKRLWKTAWENLLNFQEGNDLLIDTQGERKHITRKSIDLFFQKHKKTQELECIFKKNTIYCIKEVHSLLTELHQHPKIAIGWQKTLEKIQRNYNRSRDDTPHFTSNAINIAVHIRRGDSINTKRRFVGHSYFAKVLDQIISKIEKSNHGTQDDVCYQYAIQIYSEGSIDDFCEFRKYKNLTLRINDDHFNTLHHMVCADVLIMSKSTFSYLPALLNSKGTIIYNPFWLLPPNPLVKEWIVPDENGNCDFEISNYR